MGVEGLANVLVEFPEKYFLAVLAAAKHQRQTSEIFLTVVVLRVLKNSLDTDYG